MRKVLLAKSAGFCFGVRRAVKLAQEIAESGAPYVMLGPVIHNDHVIAQLAAQNQTLDGRIVEAEAQLRELRSGGAEQNEAIRRLNEEKLALEGKRNQTDRDCREKKVSGGTENYGKI